MPSSRRDFHLPESERTRVAVVGAGTFGRNHVRVWRELEASGAPVTLVGIVEPHPELAARLSADFGIPTHSSIPALLHAPARPQAASVAVPTHLHARVAADLLAAGIDVLLEKPMASTLEEADGLIELAARQDLLLQPGHLERFNPAVHAVEAIARRPLFFEIHRLSVFTPRSLDVDVLLDLMIHDLDIVLHLVKSPVRELHAVGLPVLSSHVDIANVRIEFESGCVANFTASRVSTERVRKLRFFEPHRYVSVDYARQDVLLVDISGEEPTLPANTLSAEPRHPTSGFSMRKLEIPPGEPLRLELESFLKSVRTRRTPEVTAAEARSALALALDIRCAIDTHRRRAGI